LIQVQAARESLRGLASKLLLGNANA